MWDENVGLSCFSWTSDRSIECCPGRSTELSINLVREISWSSNSATEMRKDCRYVFEDMGGGQFGKPHFEIVMQFLIHWKRIKIPKLTSGSDKHCFLNLWLGNFLDASLSCKRWFHLYPAVGGRDLLLKQISEGLKSISNECYIGNHPSWV